MQQLELRSLFQLDPENKHGAQHKEAALWEIERLTNLACSSVNKNLTASVDFHMVVSDSGYWK